MIASLAGPILLILFAAGVFLALLALFLEDRP